MSSQSARLIIDPPGTGSWNMAVDEALMQSTGDAIDPEGSQEQKNELVNGPPVLRFYQWSEPTLSLGYFQNWRERQTHPASLTCPLVRRNSGGGAILHDAELTYSFTIRENQNIVPRSSDLYPLIHGALLQALKDHGIEATRNETFDKNRENNFLCFQRRAPNDVLLGEHKICGSAQRKKYRVISQHGSVILQTSSKAPEIQGIHNLCKTKLAIPALIEGWVQHLSGKTGLDFVKSQLNDQEEYRGKEVEKGKFSALNWTQRR